jgi:HSP20 family protein
MQLMEGEQDAVPGSRKGEAGAGPRNVSTCRLHTQKGGETMAITQYRNRNWFSPWQELDEMSNRLNRIFQDRGLGEGDGTTWLPAVNVEETADELVLTAELPGMRREDVELELENNVLTIRGTKTHRSEREDAERRYHVWERRYGSFQRSFTLPRTVTAEEISASFDDGVLHIHMPKAPEAKGRKIEIKTESRN